MSLPKPMCLDCGVAQASYDEGLKAWRRYCDACAVKRPVEGPAGDMVPAPLTGDVIAWANLDEHGRVLSGEGLDLLRRMAKETEEGPSPGPRKWRELGDEVDFAAHLEDARGNTVARMDGGMPSDADAALIAQAWAIPEMLALLRRWVAPGEAGPIQYDTLAILARLDGESPEDIERALRARLSMPIDAGQELVERTEEVMARARQQYRIVRYTSDGKGPAYSEGSNDGGKTWTRIP